MSTRRDDIDGLRALAVGAVVLFHAGYTQFSGGFTGVDVFFVISGFLITGLIRRAVTDRTFSFSGFYLRRARRLFPALLATVALAFVGSVLILSPDLLIQYAKSAVAALASVANFYFWSDSGYFDAAAILKPLLHTWSLSVEEQFYLLWPMILVVALRRSDRVAFWTLLTLGATSLVLGLALSGYTSTVFFLMPFRVFELAAGGLLVWLRLPRVPRLLEEGALAVGLALIAGAIFLTSETTPFPISGVLPTAGAMLVIVFGRAPLVGLLLRNRFSVWLGVISYSVYLVHWPVVVLWRFYLNRDFTFDERADMLIVTLIVSGLMYWAVENRFRRPGARALSFGPYFTRYAGAICLAAIVSATVIFSGGWTWRLGPREPTYVASVNSPLSVYGGTGCRQPRCEVAGDGRPIYVMGDSHAKAYFAGIKAMTKRPLVFFESNACPFFSMTYVTAWLADDAAGGDCTRARALAFDAVRENPDVDLVIAQSWVPTDMLDPASGTIVLLPTVEAFGAFVAQHLAALQQDLHPHSLLVIGNVPTTAHYAVGPLTCLGHPQPLTEDCATSTIIYGSIIERREALNHAIASALPPTIKFFDPMPLFCDERSCRNIADDHVLYSDWDHLSTAGSQLIAAALPIE